MKRFFHNVINSVLIAAGLGIIILVPLMLILLFTGNLRNVVQYVFHNGEIGGRPSDIISSGSSIYVLSEGQRKCGFPCIDSPIDYLKPTLWEINVAENKSNPYIIADQLNVSNYSNSCDKMVDLGDSIFIHCPQSFLFSKKTKEFKRVEKPIGGGHAYYAFSDSRGLLGVIEENKINFYDKDLEVVKTFDTIGEPKGLVFIENGTLVFYSDKALVFDTEFNQTPITSLLYSSNEIFLDSSDKNVAYSYGPLGSITDQIYKLDLNTSQRLDSIAFPEYQKDRDTAYTYNVNSFAQTDQNIYFLIRNYISEPGVGKNGPVELAVADKRNLKNIKRISIEFNQNNTIAGESSSTNSNPLVINGKNIYIAVSNGWGSELLIYDLDGNFIRKWTLRK